MDAARMDWTCGQWQRTRTTAAPTAEVVIAGDWAPIRDFEPLIDQNPEAVYGSLLPELRSSNLRIFNLECPLTDGGRPMVKSGTVLRGRPRHIRGLACVPVEAVTLANNHIFDYGREGFCQTRQLLQDHRIQTVGAGLSLRQARQPLILTANGVTLGLVNFSEGEDMTGAHGEVPGVVGWQVDETAAVITELKPRVDGIVVVCHGGLEYIPFPPPYVAEALQTMAEAGADLVIGHHPHVPQGIRFHQGTPICYSLGNFVFFQPTRLLYRRLGYLVKAAFTRQGLVGLRVVPYEISPRGLLPLAGFQLRWFLRQLQEVSAPLEDAEAIRQAWQGFLAHYGVTGFRREVAAIMDQMAQDPAKGAAMFRNRLTTLQHRHHWIDTLTRLMAAEPVKSPGWARDRAREYFTRSAWPAES